MMTMMISRSVWAADAVAMVTDVRGGATLIEEGDSGKLQLLAYLVPGVQIQLEPGAAVVVTYFLKSLEYTVQGPATVTVAKDSLQVKKGGIAETRQLSQANSNNAKRFSTMQRERLAQATFVMRGMKPGLRLIDPLDTDLMSKQPVFTWSGPQSVPVYRFTLNEEGGRTLYDAKVNQASLKLPDNVSLSSGQAYRWKVETALSSGETLSATGGFTLVSEAKALAVTAARPKQDAPFSDRVLYAATLEADNLKYEARQAWRALSLERPDDIVLQEKAVR
ncbi:MAG: hypothetical protein WC208_06405 [Gallionella sp.]